MLILYYYIIAVKQFKLVVFTSFVFMFLAYTVASPGGPGQNRSKGQFHSAYAFILTHPQILVTWS